MAQGRATIKHRVKLTADERRTFEALVARGRVAGWKVRRAQAMLKCDEGDGGPAWPDQRIAEAFGMTVRTMESWRKRAVECGPLSLLQRKPQDRSHQRRLDGAGEAKLIQLACSTPPDGRARWSLRLLADRLVALDVVDSIGHETVRQVLKKGSCPVSGEGAMRTAGSVWRAKRFGQTG